MDQDTITLQLQSWLQQPSPERSAHTLDDLPISIASDVGILRQENQDRAIILRAQVSITKSFVVGVLCDGMGGMTDGAKCASLAISVFLSSCIRNRSLNVKDRITKAVLEADKAVYGQYIGNGGATLSAFIFDSDGNASGINVGDSRIYCQFKTGNIEQLSVDDTIAGQLNQPEGASNFNNKLIQYVGIGSDIEPHIIDIPEASLIQKLLLTSDGVHYLPPATLHSLIVPKISSFDLSKRLINVSNWCSGHDNATTIVVTEPSTIFDYGKNTITGTIKLCDHNSDVFLIGIEKNQPFEANAAVEKLDSTLPATKTINNEKESSEDNSSIKKYEESSIEDIEDSTKEHKKKNNQRKKVPSNRKKIDSDKEESLDDEPKPQLRMDFDE
jgi:PPM family protein phosphatase